MTNSKIKKLEHDYQILLNNNNMGDGVDFDGSMNTTLLENFDQTFLKASIKHESIKDNYP